MKISLLIALSGALACAVASAQLASDQPAPARPSGTTALASAAAPLVSDQPAPANTVAAQAPSGPTTVLPSSQPAGVPNSGSKRAVTAATQRAPASANGGLSSRVTAGTTSTATSEKQ